MNKYKGIIIKQIYKKEKLDMNYDEYIDYLTTKVRSKKSLDEAHRMAVEKFNKVLYTITKNELNSLLIERYNLYAVPSFVFIKLGKIANGTFKNMVEGRGIELGEVLRYMKVRGKFLAKQSYRVKFKSNNDRLNYELSIMVSDYPKFKKESLNKIEFDPKEAEKYKKVSRVIKKEIKDEIVVNDIINDIWGGR